MTLGVKVHVVGKAVPELQAALPEQAFLMALVVAQVVRHLSQLQLMQIVQEVEPVGMEVHPI